MIPPNLHIIVPSSTVFGYPLLFQIISAQYLPKPNASTGVIDPYVSVEIFGIPCDERKLKTRIIKNNGT